MNENFKDETVVALFERIIRRLWILCIILIIALIASNLGWTFYESQFEDVKTTTKSVEADAKDGGNATGIIGTNNGVSYGKGESNSDHN